MANIEQYEILVLGSGEAGKYLAWTMAKEGHRTALVERDELGGACPNVACLPSKNFIYSAKVASLVKRGAEFGLEMEALTINLAGVQRRKREMVEGLQRMHAERVAATGVELIMGEAHFVAPRTVEIALKHGGLLSIAGERVFLALGTRATLPDIPGLALAHPMTHVEALNLDRLPRHLIVMGGGYIGLELSQAMRRLGSRVTLIERGPQLASREDPDVGAALLELFNDEGIEVLLNTAVSRIEGRSGANVQVQVNDSHGERIIEGTDLLVATGRTANTDSVGLDHAGVRLDEHGYIKVDDRMRTSAANIWAMGDCAGSPQFTHVAFDDFRVVHSDLAGGNRTKRNRLVPFCMFTDPELARVGLNESEARRGAIDYRLAKLPMTEILRTRTVSEGRGFIKILIGRSNDQILGFSAFGFDASELMTAVQTAIIGRLPYTMLRDAIYTHPTVSEGLITLLGQVKDG